MSTGEVMVAVTGVGGLANAALVAKNVEKDEYEADEDPVIIKSLSKRREKVLEKKLETKDK